MSQNAIEVLALCERAMRENEDRRDKVTIIVNVRGRKSCGVYRLFPKCPRGRIIKKFRVGRTPYFSVEYNAMKLAEAITAQVGRVSAFKRAMEEHAVAAENTTESTL